MLTILRLFIVAGLFQLSWWQASIAPRLGDPWTICVLSLGLLAGVYGWIGRPLAYYKRLGEKTAHLPMGALGEIIPKIRREGHLPRTRYLNFEGNPLMEEWEENLNAVALDRDLLAHGIVRSGFDQLVS